MWRTSSKVGDLTQRRLGDLEPRPRERVEEDSQPPGIGDVLHAEPAVDEDEPVLALNQQAVAAHRRDRPGAAFSAEEPPAARA